MIIVETFARGCTIAISPDRSNPDRQLMIAIARSRRPNVDHSCRLCSIDCELIRPKTRAVHQITPPMASRLVQRTGMPRHCNLTQRHPTGRHDTHASAHYRWPSNP
jgi:hypothetical protein